MILSPKLFLDELVKKNTISQQTADSYQVDALQKNLPIDVYLLKEIDMDKNIVLEAKAKLLNTPYVNITATAIDPQALEFIPAQLAKTYNMIPYLYDVKNETLYVATSDPLNLTAREFFETKTKKKVIFALALVEDILKTIDNTYSQSIGSEVNLALKEASFQDTSALSMNETKTGDAPITKIVYTVLELAIKSRTSDIHIEPEEVKTRIRYRIDGILQEKITLPKGLHDALISRIKILGQMKIDEKRSPQDGRFSFKYGDIEIDLRVSSLPTVHGEKIVMRILKKSGGLPTVSELGVRGPAQRDLEESIRRPYGIFLVTGPTGSGKTTTLYSILTSLNKPTTNIVTLEDPVEYQIPGINQVQVNPQAGLTFANGLRSFLRQDPNIILVGEIRDTETTQLAIQAALTGHLVFATLHTNDAATTIPRLIDLGGEPFLIASVLIASQAQRILRKVCENCKETYDPPIEIQQDIRQVLGKVLPQQYQGDVPIKLTKGKGCDECVNGYVGRIGIFEILKMTPNINQMVMQHSTAKEIEKKAIEEGLITMKQDGYLKALDGLTTIEEVLRVAE